MRKQLSKSIERLAELPDSGRIETGISFQGLTVCSTLVKQYRVLYVVEEEALVVVRVIHTSQNIDEIELIRFPE